MLQLGSKTEGQLREVQNTAPWNTTDRSIDDCRQSTELVDLWREPFIFNLIEGGKEVLGKHVFD